MNSKFEEKTILITGSGGFLGGHLVCHFLQKGWKVLGLLHQEANENQGHKRLREQQKRELFSRIPPQQIKNLELISGDISQDSDLKTVFAKKPQAIIHAAAQLIPPDEKNYLNSGAFLAAKQRFLEINQAQALADWISKYQKETPDFYALLISTIHVFSRKTEYIDEETKYEPLNFYAQSKDIAHEYWCKKVANLAILYPPQIYGPYQFTPALVPRLIKKMLFNEGEELSLSGLYNPIHVDNLSKFIVLLCENQENGSFCIDGDGALSLLDIAHNLEEIAIEVLKPEDKYPFTAYHPEEKAQPPTLPKISDKKALGFFSRHEAEALHKPIPLAETAEAMLKTSYEHWKY